MSIMEANNAYKLAHKKALKRYQNDVKRGADPYPKILDELLAGKSVAGRVELGVFDVPTARIVGMVSAGRKTAFSADFGPLLEEDTEFGMKWIALCSDHLGDTGIRDPIRCYEYLGDFYVLEGNKRVSVLSAFDAPTVAANVLRILPAWEDTEAIRVYYSFLAFFSKSRLYAVRCTREGQYEKLQARLGFSPEHVWTSEQRQSVQSLYTRFCGLLGSLPAGTTEADVFLEFLSVYSPADARTMTDDAMRAAIAAAVAEASASVTVATEAAPQGKSVLSRLVDAVLLPDSLTASWIHPLSPDTSDWAAAHERGRIEAETAFTGRVKTASYIVSDAQDTDACFKAAAEDGAQVIFATTPSLITACRKAAVTYPQIKILNCSVIMPYPGVRTYYSRIYEAKFLSGVIAGALTRTDAIGYIASSPIFGVIAGVNAFALGAKMTNPRARVRLHWSCCEEGPISALLQEGADLISNRDLPMPGREQELWGLNLVNTDGTFRPLAAPYWNWGEFYRRLLSDILNGHWEDNAYKDAAHAVNYWWGMQSKVVDIVLQDGLPEGVKTLVSMLQKELAGESQLPFFREIVSQDGTVRSDGTRPFTPQELLEMDWLCDNVDGEIPAYDTILPYAKALVRLEGIYRDRLPEELHP